MDIHVGRTVRYALLALILAASFGLDPGAVGSLTTDDYTMTGN